MGRRSKRARDTVPADELNVPGPVGVLTSHMDDRMGKRLVLQAMVSGVDSLAALPRSDRMGEASLDGSHSLGWMAEMAGGRTRVENTRVEPFFLNMFVSPRNTREFEEEEDRNLFSGQATPELDKHTRTEGEEEDESGAKFDEEISAGSDGSSSESVGQEAPRKRGRGGALEGILNSKKGVNYWKGKSSAFKKKFLSFSSSCARNSRRKQILKILQEVKGKPELPVTPDELTVAATVLDEAKLVSADQYLHEIKLMQVEMGGDWGLTLERQLKMCKTALSRNKGPEKRAKEVVVNDLKEETWNDLGVRQADLERPAWCYAWATVWMLRAAEAAKVLVKHVSIKHSPRHVTLYIPLSKMDQKGKGVSRTLQCCGLPDCHRWCAWGLALKTLALHKTGKAGDALFPLVNGGKPKKSTMVRNWQKFLDIEMGGHSARRSGAMAHARSGMSVTCISYLGRWRSSAVLRYVEEALQFIPSNTEDAKTSERGEQKVERRADPDDQEKNPPGVNKELSKVGKKTIEIKKEVNNTHIHEVKLNDVQNLYAVAPKRGGGKIAHWVSKAAWGVDLNDWATACGWRFAKKFEKVQLTTDVPAKAYKCSKCEGILKGRDFVMGGMTLAQMLSSQFNKASGKSQ